MTQWLTPALLALLSFGLWGFFSKLAMLYFDSKSALFYQSIGFMLIGLMTLAMLNFKPATEMKGASFGLLSGLATGAGCLLFLIAVDKGKVTTVTTLTALYPFITILLSYFLLHETINLKQCFGVILALIAIYLMSF